MQPLRSFFRRIFFALMYRFGEPPWDTGISPPELLEFIAEQPPGRALDMGCGTGTNVITLANHGWQAVGVDFIAQAVAAARKKAQAAGVQAHFFTGDVARLEAIGAPELDPPFDLVLDIGCLHNLQPDARERTINNLERLLAPDGCYLLYGFLQAPDGEGAGLTPANLQALNRSLALLTRQDGTDRGARPSVWLKYKRAA
ncbi:MAG TPA: class I SAM-dependent methyltransferase [Anaerolineales bacterium]|nr:class I SAM-dependent methyltransferase [Anaerolineales bacterium]